MFLEYVYICMGLCTDRVYLPGIVCLPYRLCNVCVWVFDVTLLRLPWGIKVGGKQSADGIHRGPRFEVFRENHLDRT